MEAKQGIREGDTVEVKNGDRRFRGVVLGSTPITKKKGGNEVVRYMHTVQCAHCGVSEPWPEGQIRKVVQDGTKV